MNYKESRIILKEIKKANSFIMFCHEGPDFDSIISSLLMERILRKMGKKAEIFSPEDLGETNKYLDKEGRIKVRDSQKIDFSKYDILFALDVNELSRFGLDKNFHFNGKIINIDHHEGERCGDINIFDRNTGATCSLLYLIFKDWQIELSLEELNMILLGIVSDTGIFHFSMYQKTKAFKIVGELMKKGANYEQALYYVDQCNSLETYRFYAEVLGSIKINKERRFAYTFISAKVFHKYKKFGVRSRQISDQFIRNIKGTDFGMVLIEDEPGVVKVSIRTRTPGYYTIDLVKKLGGGGHLTGGGATVIVESRKTADAVNKILEQASEFSLKKNNNDY